MAGAVARTGMGADGRADAGVPQETRYRRVRLVGAGGSASKIGDASSGNLRPLAQVTGNLTFTLVLNVSSEEGVSGATLENTIKETMTDWGAAGGGGEGVGGTNGPHTLTTSSHTSSAISPGARGPRCYPLLDR